MTHAAATGAELLASTLAGVILPINQTERLSQAAAQQMARRPTCQSARLAPPWRASLHADGGSGPGYRLRHGAFRIHPCWVLRYYMARRPRLLATVAAPRLILNSRNKIVRHDQRRFAGLHRRVEQRQQLLQAGSRNVTAAPHRLVGKSGLHVRHVADAMGPSWSAAISRAPGVASSKPGSAEALEPGTEAAPCRGRVYRHVLLHFFGSWSFDRTPPGEQRKSGRGVRPREYIPSRAS